MEWDEIRKVTRVRCIEDVIVKDTRLRDFEIGDFEAKQPLDKSPIIAFVKGKIYDARLGILQNSPWDVPIRALYVPKNEEGLSTLYCHRKGRQRVFQPLFRDCSEGAEMMGRSQKQKGNRREREFAKLIGGTRVPLSGAAKYAGTAHAGDVVDSRGIRWEVKAKAREDGFKTIYRWLEPDHVDALALKGDRKEWLVVLPLPLFLSLLGDRKDDSPCGSESST